MLSASHSHIFLVSFWLIIMGLSVPAKSKTLKNVMRSTYVHHHKNVEPINTAGNIFEAQAHSIDLAQRNKDVALNTANAYSDLYFARRLNLVAQGQLKFIRKQVETEEKKFEQGFTTRTNLFVVKTYEHRAHKLALSFERDLEITEAKFLQITGDEAPTELVPFKLGNDLVSVEQVLDGISLSHPALMRKAYQIKNARIAYDRSKQKQNATLRDLETLIIQSEISFDETLEKMSMDAQSLYENYLWANKQMVVGAKQIETTKISFDAAFEERKHNLKNTPELMLIFDEAIKARIEFLRAEKKSNRSIITLMSLMGKLVPDEFVFRQKLVWHKSTKQHYVDKLALNGR